MCSAHAAGRAWRQRSKRALEPAPPRLLASPLASPLALCSVALALSPCVPLTTLCRSAARRCAPASLAHLAASDPALCLIRHNFAGLPRRSHMEPSPSPTPPRAATWEGADRARGALAALLINSVTATKPLLPAHPPGKKEASLVDPDTIRAVQAYTCDCHAGACSHRLTYDVIRRCREAYAGLHTEEDRLQWIAAELKRRLELPPYVLCSLLCFFFGRRSDGCGQARALRCRGHPRVPEGVDEGARLQQRQVLPRHGPGPPARHRTPPPPRRAPLTAAQLTACCTDRPCPPAPAAGGHLWRRHCTVPDPLH